MSKNLYVPSAIIKLFTEFANLKDVTPDIRGLASWGKRIDISNKKVQSVEVRKNGEHYPFNPRYLSMRFKEAEESLNVKMLSLDSDKLDSIAEECGYDNITDFLIRKGYIDEDTEGVIPSKNLDRLWKRNPPHPSEWLDKYILGARIVPALVAISSIPITLLLLASQYQMPSNLSLIFILILFSALAYSIAAWNSENGKNYEKKYFHSSKGMGFPTTYLMLYSYNSNYVESQKIEYRQNISAYFNINFLSEEQEKKNINRTKDLLNQAGIKVKNNVNSNKIRSANIKYGLIRNLIPATLVASILSFLCLLIGILLSQTQILICFSIMAPIFIIAHIQLRFGNSFKNAAEAFAIYLLDEFLSR